MTILKIISLCIITSYTFASQFSYEQENLLKVVYNIGSKISSTNGLSFEKTLTSIVLTETSGGKYLIGDSFTKKKVRRHLLKNSLGPFQIRIDTVKYMATKIKSLAFLKNKSDWYIMNKLLNDYVFGAIIAANYLKLNYERTGNNYFQSISRYNGGKNNVKYYSKVMKNMKIVKKLEKEMFFN